MTRLFLDLLLTSLMFVSCSHNMKQAKKEDNISQLSAAVEITSSIKTVLLPKKDSTIDRACQTNNYIGECFLLDSGKVMIYDNVKGNVVDSISNNYQIEDYYQIQIIKQRRDWFKIEANAIKKEKSGWVKINPNYFGVYAANYTGPLTIYQEPDKNSKKVYTFPEYFTEPFNVFGCKQGWLQVVLEKDNQIYKGWVPKELTCPNPYSTCN